MSNSASNAAMLSIKKIHDGAIQQASSLKHSTVCADHITLFLMDDSDFTTELCDIFGMDASSPEIIVDTIKDAFSRAGIPSSNSIPTPGSSFTAIISQTLGYINSRSSLPDKMDLYAALLVLRNIVNKQDSITFGIFQSASHSNFDDLIDKVENNQVKQGKVTSAKKLSDLCVNLNEKVIEGKIDPIIGRSTEITKICETISRRNKRNAMVLGDAGVGKTALAEGLAYKIVKGEVPDHIKNCVVYSLSVSDIIAGSRYRGDMEEKLKSLLTAITSIEDHTPVLFIDEIHMIMNAGSGGDNGGGLDIANMLKQYLSKGELICIGATTHEEFRKKVEKDKAFVRRFTEIIVNEPSPDECKLILKGINPGFVEHHGLVYDDDAIDLAVDLSVKYIFDRKLPDKAIDIIDAVAASLRVKGKTEGNVTATDIKEFMVAKYNIPLNIEEKEDLSSYMKSLSTSLYGQVFGQDTAIKTLLDNVSINKAGLREGDKPEGVYLLVGPSGSGKTETAKAVAAATGKKLITYNMSEYMEEHSVAKFIGAPPGYAGFSDGDAGSGKLINDVSANPNCVILFDEIEKAHPRVLNIFLQIFEEAELVASSGKKANFRQAICFMTSNCGARELERKPMGFASAFDNVADNRDDAEIKKFFPPEFRNRLDAILKYNALGENIINKIVDKFINSLNERAASRNVTVILSEEARNYLVKNGVDSAMGARPLKRLINEKIGVILAKEMINGFLKSGGVATVNIENGEFKLDPMDQVILEPETVSV